MGMIGSDFSVKIAERRCIAGVVSVFEIQDIEVIGKVHCRVPLHIDVLGGGAL